MNAGHRIDNVWTDTHQVHGPGAKPRPHHRSKTSSIKDERAIKTRADSEKFSVENCPNDCHEEMDSSRFERWFDQLLLRVELNSSTVTDNSSYHSRKLENVRNTSSGQGS